MRNSAPNTDQNISQRTLLILHVYLVIFITIFISCLVFRFYEYQPNKIPQPREFVLNSTLQGTSEFSVNREGKERLSYVLSTTCASAAVFLSFFLLHLSNKLPYYRRLISALNNKNFYVVLITMSSCLVFFVGMSMLISDSFLSSSYQKLELYSSPFVIILGLLIALSTMCYSAFRSELVEKKISLLFILSAISLSLFISSCTLFDEYSLEKYSINFSPVVYPIIQTFLGKAPLIDLKSLYGLHPYFLQIFLYLFPAKILTLSFVLAALLLISLLSIAFCLFCVIRNKLVALIGFIAIIYLQNFTNNWWPEPTAIAFQYEPIRLLFPSLLLSFLCLFFKNPTPRKYYGALIFFSFSTLWNLDTGIPTFLTLVIILGYEKFFLNKKEGFSVTGAAKHLAKSLGILAAIWFIFLISLKIKYGQWPEISWLFYGQSAAFDFGYAMMPMYLGIWVMSVLIYATGFVMSSDNFFKKRHSLQDNFILVLTILGLGLFTYFIGRSHSSNVLHCGYPAAILLTIFVDKFCASFGKKDFIFFLPKFKTDTLIFALPLLLISYLSSAFLFNSFSFSKLQDNLISSRFSSNSYQIKPYWVQEADFIKEHINNIDPAAISDDSLIISLGDQDYYFALELRSKFPFSFANLRHMFYEEELNELYHSIEIRRSRFVILISKPKEIFPILSNEEMANLEKKLLSNYQVLAKLQIDQENSVTIYKKP
jgi:hypothetical protein